MCRMEAYSTCSEVFENFNNIDGGETFQAGKWYHVAVAMGSEVNGIKSIFLMSGSQPGLYSGVKDARECGFSR